MDVANRTINRHNPDIPPSMYFGMTPEYERRYNKIYRSTLELCGVKKFIAKKRNVYARDDSKLSITQEILDVAKIVDPKLDDISIDYLANRGVSLGIANKYRICSTSILTSLLPNDAVENLSLCIPRRFDDYIDDRSSDGISVPYYFRGIFCGFLTRFIGSKSSFVKYAFTCPSRVLFGVDWNVDEVFVVEGLFDAIAMSEFGYNATALCDSQPCYFKLYWISKFEKINLLFDNDYAGYLGALKSYIALINLFDIDDSRINILLLKGKDPSELCEWDQISFNDLKNITERARDEIENVV